MLLPFPPPFAVFGEEIKARVEVFFISINDPSVASHEGFLCTSLRRATIGQITF